MNRFCSMFSQILQLFPRSDFQLLVKETKAERHARGFNCWSQFIAMMFCQLGRAHSLREICHGLSSCEGKALSSGNRCGSPSFFFGLCQSTSALGAVPETFLSIAGALPPRCSVQKEVPLQEQAGQLGLHGDRPVRERV